MSDGESEHVAPFRGKDYGTDEMAMVHNHQDGTFLSPSDFTSAFFNNNNMINSNDRQTAMWKCVSAQRKADEAHNSCWRDSSQ